MAAYPIIFENLANINLHQAPATDPAQIIEGIHVQMPIWEPTNIDNVRFCNRTLLSPVNLLVNGAVYFSFPVGAPVRLTLRNDGFRQALLTVPNYGNVKRQGNQVMEEGPAAPPPAMVPPLRRGGRRTRTTRRNRTRTTRRTRRNRRSNRSRRNRN